MTSIQQRDVQAVLAAIDDLLPQIRERAQATEDLRRLPDETVQALDDVGFFTLLQPEQWGGLQCDPTLFYEATRDWPARFYRSASSIVGAYNWHLALFDQRERKRVRGETRERGFIVVRPDGRGRRGRRRLSGQRLVELVVGLRPCHLTARGRPGHQGRAAGGFGSP